MEFVRKYALLLVVGCLLLVNLFIWQEVYSGNGVSSNELKVYFLDVGQGDATFIEAPNGNQVLIDGGRTDNKVLQELGEIMQVGDRSIDVVISTHPDADHIGGLPEVFSRFEVAKYIESGNQTKETKIAEMLLKSAKEEVGLDWIIAGGGQTILLDEKTGVYLEILFPDRDVSKIESNASSIVARLVYGESCFLFMGDSPKAIETYLKQQNENLDCDVLKVGHHGSRTSSDPLFVEAVSPEYAVISSGKDNSYGHPHKEVLDILQKQGVEILRTDLNGRVKFISDGISIILEK